MSHVITQCTIYIIHKWKVGRLYADATRIRNPAEIGLLELKHNKENPTQLKISSNMKIFLFLKNIYMEIFSYTAKNMKIFSHLKIIAKLQQKKENPT